MLCSGGLQDEIEGTGGAGMPPEAWVPHQGQESSGGVTTHVFLGLPIRSGYPKNVSFQINLKSFGSEASHSWEIPFAM